MNEIRVGAFRLLDDLDRGKALQDLFPKDRQLHFCQSVADTAMNAETERQMMTGLRPVDDTNEAYKLGVNFIIYGLTH